MQTFTAVIHREEDMFVAECPEVGPASQGATIEGALANLKEATQLYLDEFPIDLKPARSFVTTFEVAEIAGT
jgi:predicted RNase H-like HicB family nuclease